MSKDFKDDACFQIAKLFLVQSILTKNVQNEATIFHLFIS